jgi:hypothetical protein
MRRSRGQPWRRPPILGKCKRYATVTASNNLACIQRVRCCAVPSIGGSTTTYYVAVLSTPPLRVSHGALSCASASQALRIRAASAGQIDGCRAAASRIRGIPTPDARIRLSVVRRSSRSKARMRATSRSANG